MLPLLLVAPSVLLLTVLVAFPLVFSLRNSFYFWNLQMSPKPLGFIGFGNYRAAIAQSDFFEALRHTLEIALIGTAIEVAAGLAIAHLLTVRLVGIDLCRALLIMPTTIAPIVTGFLFRYMYDAQGGLIPWLIRTAHLPIPAQGLLGSEQTALWAILFADIWQWTPFCAIILYAGLLSVPDEIVEAARIDGAGDLMLWYLGLLMAPPVAFLIPYFIVATAVGLTGTYLAMILVLQTIVVPFSVWLLKSFFDDIPVDLEQSAALDGARLPAILWHITLPLAAPGLVVTAMFAFVFAWNNAAVPLVLSDQDTATLPVGTLGYFGNTGITWNDIGAAAGAAMLPPMVIFLIMGRYVVRGLTFGSVKG